MSQTYNLVCPETKKVILVGQRDYLHSDEERMKALAEWLHDHKDKHIFFVNEESALLDDIPEGRFVGLEPKLKKRITRFDPKPSGSLVP